MRHRKSFNHLGRKTAHRSAMLANMASSLILHKRIETTTAKAKALRGYVEPLITKSKEDTTHSRRTVFSYLQNKDAVTELFREVSVKVADRPGGYLRLLKIGSRLGDNAEMCIVELVDYNENLLGDTSGEKAKTGRRRRGAKKKAEQPQAAEVKAAPVTPPAESVISDAEIVTEEEVSAVAEENVMEEEVSAAAEDNIVEEEKESSSESTKDVDGEKK
jgi:large subunit ribosomal protein L17